MFRSVTSLTGGANILGATAGLGAASLYPEGGDIGPLAGHGSDAFVGATSGGATTAQVGTPASVAATFAMDPWEARLMALKGPVDEIQASAIGQSAKEGKLFELAKTNILAVTALCYPEDLQPASLKLSMIDLQYMHLQGQLETLCRDPRYATQMFDILATLGSYNMQGIHAIYRLYRNDPAEAINTLSRIANGKFELEHRELARSYLTKIDDELVDGVVARITDDIAEEFRMLKLMNTEAGRSSPEFRSLMENRDHYRSVSSFAAVDALYALITGTDKTSFNTRAFRLFLGGGAEISDLFRNKVFNELTMDDGKLESPLVSLWVELAQRFDPTEIVKARSIIHDRAENGTQDGFSIRTSGRMIQIIQRIDIAHKIARMMRNFDSSAARIFATLCYYENKSALSHARREKNSHVLVALESEFAMATDDNLSFRPAFFLKALENIDTDATDEILAGLRKRGLIS